MSSLFALSYSRYSLPTSSNWASCLCCDGYLSHVTFTGNVCQDYSFLVSHGSLFPHPATGQAAYVVMDACHMLRLRGMYVKLIRS